MASLVATDFLIECASKQLTADQLNDPRISQVCLREPARGAQRV